MVFRALALFGFSAAVLISEIALTRLFSVIFWYHFAFLILSTALLGFAAAGLILRLLRARLDAVDPDRAAAAAMTISGVALAAALHLLTVNHFSPLYIQINLAELWKMLVAVGVLAVPFAAMGAAVLILIQRFPERVGLLYAANLAGSGAGCLAAVGLLDAVGGLTAFVVAAALMPSFGALIALPRIWGRGRWRAAAFAALAAAALLASLAASDRLYPLKSPDRKFVSWVKPEDRLWTDWTSLSRVDIYKADWAHAHGFGLWGISPTNAFALPERLGVVIDYWAYTTIVKHSLEPGYYTFYNSLPAYLAYRLKLDAKALVIGSGGGMDIQGARFFGAREIDAVEINPSIVKALETKFAQYSGDVYRLSGVKGHVAEGRHFVESSRERYDIIQLSGVDTYSATQAGAFALSENFLYTMEAMKSYYDHLTDDGVLTLTRWWGLSKEGLPRFSLRLFVLAFESLAAYGISDPAQHILFVRSGEFTVILVKKQPFRPDEIHTIDLEAQARGYKWIFRPDHPQSDPPAFAEYARAADRQAWLDAYPFLVSPPTDDSPFYFEHRKMSHILSFESFIIGFDHGFDGQTVLAILLAELLAAAALLLWLSRRLHGGFGRARAWLYFAAIGLGFMLVESSLVQRLVLVLGHPVYALSVVMFALLVFSGAGALFSPRLARRFPIAALLGLVAGYWALWAAVSGPVLRSLVSWPDAPRFMAAVALLALPAFLMGLAFPEAVRRLSAAGERDLGVYWAWNGLASVTASVLAVILAISYGFTLVMALAALCYALAAWLLPRLAPR
ncbi:MAG: hypothetical protein C4523_06740 [Myxococcales bacterium]|nr:MAG: hypothetical protein C4523_06740 [Myxococcales bacterium]